MMRQYLIRDIERAACSVFGVTKDEMRSKSRLRRISRPRQIVMYLARELTPASYPMIGRHFGGRDHTTILHGKRKIAELLRTTNTMAGHVDDVRQKLRERAS